MSYKNRIITLEDFGNMEDAVVSAETVEHRASEWEKLLAKYAKCEEGDEDGLTIEELEGHYTDEEESIDVDNSESNSDDFISQSEDEHDNKQLVPVKAGEIQNALLYFSEDVIKAFHSAYKKRIAQINRKKLPLWNIAESHIATESISESFFKTPTVNFESRNTKKVHEIHRSLSTVSNLPLVSPEMNFSTMNFNGISGMRRKSFSSPDLPEAIKQLMQSNRNFTIRIREREYDVQMNGMDDSSETLQLENSRALKQPDERPKIKFAPELEIVKTPKEKPQSRRQAKEKLEKSVLKKEPIEIVEISDESFSEEHLLDEVLKPKCSDKKKMPGEKITTFRATDHDADNQTMTDPLRFDRKKRLVVGKSSSFSYDENKKKPAEKSPNKENTQMSSIKETSKNVEPANLGANEEDISKKISKPLGVLQTVGKNQEVPTGHKVQYSKASGNKKQQQPLKTRSTTKSLRILNGVDEQTQLSRQTIVKKKSISLQNKSSNEKSISQNVLSKENSSEKITAKTTSEERSGLKSQQTPSQFETDEKQKVEGKCSSEINIKVIPNITPTFAIEDGNIEDSQLADISCGSSCSTITSDDEKFFQKHKFDKLRKQKKMKHKFVKFIERTGLSQTTSKTQESTSVQVRANQETLSNQSKAAKRTVTHQSSKGSEKSKHLFSRSEKSKRSKYVKKAFETSSSDESDDYLTLAERK